MVFREYDKEFKQAKSRPPWLGLLGPTLRAQEGETIVVTFRNMATKPLSIHPHGVAYGKQSEGANYFDNTSQKEKEDDVVWPDREHVYFWEVTSEVSPQQNDPTCLTYTYVSHKDVVEDYNSGLIGVLLVCKPGSLDESGEQVRIHHEYVFLFGVFNESESKYKREGHASSDLIKYTINGFAEGSLPGESAQPIYLSVYLSICLSIYLSIYLSVYLSIEMGCRVLSAGSFVPDIRICTYAPVSLHLVDIRICTYAPVSLHLVGMSSDPEVFSVHINGQVLQQDGHKMSSVGLISGSTATVSMVAVHTGRWLLSSHTIKHIQDSTYTWKVTEEDEPLDGDARCLTRLYHSAVDTPRDIASGLIGPLLICKSQSLNVRNVQLKADKEQHAIFSVFDENMSWYLDDNIRNSCDRSKVNKADPNFYKSNVMHTINGYVFESSPTLGFCNGEVTTWHVSSVGAQDYIQTATFYGHAFELNERTEDFLSLYPMTGQTISMNMDNIGMRVKFQDVECYRDYQYDYSDNDNLPKKEFIVWNLQKETIQKNEKEPEVEKTPPGEIDVYTEMFANELGLRSQKQQSNSTDVDLLDLSFLDYEVVNVSNETEADLTKTKSKTFTAEINGLNDNSLPMRKDRQNLTGVDFLNQLDSKNLTAMQNSSASASEKVTNLTETLKNLTASDSNVDTPADGIKTLLSTPKHNVGKNSSASATEKVSNLTETLKNLTASDSDVDTPADGIKTLLSTPKHNVGKNSSASATEKVSNLTETLKNLTASDSDVDTPADGIKTLLSTPKHNVGKNSSIDGHYLSGQKAHGSHLNSSEKMNSFISNFINDTAGSLKNGSATANLSTSNAINNELDRISSPKQPSHKWFETVVSSVPSLSKNETVTNSSEEFRHSESSEEVFILVKDKDAGIIKTTSVKTSGHNWTYDGTHQIVPMEIPDDIEKYLEKSPKTQQKKMKKVTVPHRPQKGQGMKTKRRKDYEPKAKSGLPFSPRGFNPIMSPRGARPQGLQPVNEEENLINNPVVIGVPRPDFSDYELYLPGDEPDRLGSDEQNVKANEYEYVSYKDPYSSDEDAKNFHLDQTNRLKQNADKNTRTYFIAAEEVLWDYAGYGQRRYEKATQNSRETKFLKVVFRLYTDSSFSTPEIRGEVDEHLGILGPVIKAEVGQTIMVVFKNNSTRPYSLHPNGVSYSKRMEGLSYEDGSNYWYKYDNEVKPGDTYVYMWNVNSLVGPTSDKFDCRTWVYYSGVNPERDIHSGLIGPLLVCREGTLDKELSNTREFTLLFMTFDESQSWYFDRNREIMQRKNWRKSMELDNKENLKFHSINGIIYSLKGLRMYTNQLVSWHLINMGSPQDFNSVHFHGQTFLHNRTTSSRQAVYPLLPGSFATLEMYPSKPGLWLLETEVGFNQEKGMQTLFLVIADECYHPLGLESGSVSDRQITAKNIRGYWEPHLARLNNQGKYNAWSTEDDSSWIQVDFQRPVVISQVATQGAKQFFQSQYVVRYYISYSNDRRRWTFYKGDSRDVAKIFSGNQDAYGVKKTTFFPPVIGRFIRFHPLEWYNKATLRMEFYGCEVDGCSVPLGMENGIIEDHQITASSTASSWFSGPWRPSLGRLNRAGTVNAWRAEFDDMNQWLQIELRQVKKITGIVTQGAKSMRKEMFVTSFALQYSDNGKYWNHYTDDEGIPAKIFLGNTNNSDHVRNYMYPPIFSRFIRIIPKSWMGSITMRVELLGCD
ncbi:unnamed protein product, partial [Tetraodon nigroviridis]